MVVFVCDALGDHTVDDNSDHRWDDLDDDLGHGVTASV